MNPTPSSSESTDAQRATATGTELTQAQTESSARPSRKASIIFLVLVAGIIGGVYYTMSSQVAEQFSTEKIKIVASFPARGQVGGDDIANGSQLALEEAGYTAGDFLIEFEIMDDGAEDGSWLPEQEEANATAAVNDPDVMVYLATLNSGAAKVSIPITNRAGLAQISPANTWPGLTQPGFLPGEPGIFYPTGNRNYFRTSPTDALQGPAAAIWAKELGAERVYVFNDGDAYGKGIADIFANKAKDIGLAVLGNDTINPNTDFTTLIEAIKPLSPDLIYFGGNPENGSGPLVQAIRKNIPDARFMVPDGVMNQSYLDFAGEAAEGTYLTTIGVPADKLTTPQGRTFYEAYKAKYGSEPGTYAGFSYEAIKVILRAIERAGVKDRTKILNEIAETKEYDGIYGSWGFDRNGDTSLSAVSGIVVRNQKFEFQQVLTQ